MAVDFDRIDFESPAEAVFQSFRRFAMHDSAVKLAAMPIYDFGRLLNLGSPVFIGTSAYDEAATSTQRVVAQRGTYHLPHDRCAFLNRYRRSETPDYMVLTLAIIWPDGVRLYWSQWDEKGGWQKMAFAIVVDNKLQFTLTTPRRDAAELYRNTYMTAFSAGLHLIFARGGEAVDITPRVPMPTKGRTKVHPLAPSSVITIRVDQIKLNRPLPTIVEASGPKREVKPHNRAGALPFYKHPRYKNVRGTRGTRKSAAVNGGAEAAKTYQITTTPLNEGR